MRFRGRTTLITGAVGGIGEASCRRIAEEGGRLVVTDLDLVACGRLTEELPGDDHLALALDVGDETAWIAVADRLRADGIALHALVNNAGIGSLASVEDEDAATWDRVVRINQTGTWLGMKHVGPLVTGEEPGGAIVNMCSMFGTSGGFGGSAAYHASKGAVRTLTKSAAMHWADAGTRVNSVHPGHVATPGLLERHRDSDRYREMVAFSPMGRLAEPCEVAAAIAFLASADSTFMTGSELYVDGGATAR